VLGAMVHLLVAGGGRGRRTDRVTVAAGPGEGLDITGVACHF
jgi:hypothetical protein